MTTSLTLATVGLTLVALAGGDRRWPARARADAWMFLGFVGAPAIALIAVLSTSRPDKMEAPTGKERAAESPSPPRVGRDAVPDSWSPTTEPPVVPVIRTVQSRQPAPLKSRSAPETEAP
jgi:hypothetical protein